eukprot:SAG31_NODE_4834_length_2918_cov_1.628946_4_plen_112_part_00
MTILFALPLHSSMLAKQETARGREKLHWIGRAWIKSHAQVELDESNYSIPTLTRLEFRVCSQQFVDTMYCQYMEDQPHQSTWSWSRSGNLARMLCSNISNNKSNRAHVGTT